MLIHQRMPKKINRYLDVNAGLPLRAKTLLDLAQSFEEENRQSFGNPSSVHAHGRDSKRLLSEARLSIARSLGPQTDTEQLVFTSSGSESNQTAIRSALTPFFERNMKPHWVTSSIEHHSVLEMVDWVRSKGGSVSLLPVNSQGEVQTEALAQMLRSDTALVSLVWVNNETGVINDLKQLRTALANYRGKLHIDAAQAWGKLPFSANEVGADYLSFSGHKIGALPGTGLLWIKRGAPFNPLIRGTQELGRRGGTENLVGQVSLGIAASKVDPESFSRKLAPLRDKLEDAIKSEIPGSIINGSDAPRIANTLNLNFSGVEGESLVMALDLAGYSVSSGSACASGVLEPSHVLLAMGKSRGEAVAALRVSLGIETEFEELKGFVEELKKAVKRVREAREFRSGYRAESSDSRT